MNKHSKAYDSKKEELLKMEKELREVLEQESEDVEKTVLNALKIAAAVSTAILIGYGIYKWTSGSRESVPEKKKTNGFLEKIVDKVADVVTGLAVQNVSNYLDKLKNEVTTKR